MNWDDVFRELNTEPSTWQVWIIMGCFLVNVNAEKEKGEGSGLLKDDPKSQVLND
jgi:hypothetical protein